MKLTIYTITHGTKDYGEKFVCRAHVVTAGKVTPAAKPLAVVDTLEAARSAAYEAGATSLLARDPNDDPVIVESWI